MKLFEDVFVQADHSIKEVIRLIDRNGLGTAIVVDKKRTLLGIITSGDIRRSLRNGQDIYARASEVMNPRPISILASEEKKKYTLTQLFKRVQQHGNKVSEEIFSITVPIVDKKCRVRHIASYALHNKTLVLKKKGEKSANGGTSRVLVVGGAGYLGSVLSQLLLDRGYVVRVLDILLFGKDHLRDLEKNKNFQLIRGDIRDISVLNQALDGVDAVIDLAAIVGDPAGKKSPKDTVEVNYLATTSLAMACKYHQINRFIYASTCSVYGISDDKAAESSPLHPVSLYARTKIESEKGILSLADENFTPIILRMSTLYGLSPRMRFDLVVNTFSKKATVDKKIEVFGGKQWRPLLHVKDAAMAYVCCLETPMSKLKRMDSLIFNVGSDKQNYSIEQLAKMVRRTIPKTIITVKEQKDDQGSIDRRTYKVSFEKIRKLGFQAKQKIIPSIKEIHRAIVSKNIENVEDRRYYNADQDQEKIETPYIVAIIPARGGSKSIPRKNIKRLGKKPLIAWPIELAKSIPEINRVIVSSEDEEILRVARKFGAETPFVRPKKLAQDKTPTLPVLQHAVREIEREGQHVDIVLLLYPTNPFLKKERVLEGIRYLTDKTCNSVLGMKEVKGRVWKFDQKRKKHLPFYPKISVNRQYLDHLYEEAGNIYFTKAHILLKHDKIIDEHACRFIYVTDDEVIDIDTFEDFKKAESVLEQRKGKI